MHVEELAFTFPATQRLGAHAHVGVVASGNLEILFTPASGETAEVRIETTARGFAATWEAVLARFFAEHPVAAEVKILDFGATPAVVALRLLQALEDARR